MYSQGLIGSDQSTEETPEFLAAFQARIDAEQKIEPNDPMPAGYRKTLVRMIGQHARNRRHVAGRQLDNPCADATP